MQTETSVPTSAPALEQIECIGCGTVTLDGKCTTPECPEAAAQSVPKGSLTPNGIAMPSAFTIRGRVD
jgi:hypothetical protein